MNGKIFLKKGEKHRTGNIGKTEGTKQGKRKEKTAENQDNVVSPE